MQSFVFGAGELPVNIDGGAVIHAGSIVRPISGQDDKFEMVSIDAHGRNLFEENKVIFNQRKDKAVEVICKYVSFIK